MCIFHLSNISNFSMKDISTSVQSNVGRFEVQQLVLPFDDVRSLVLVGSHLTKRWCVCYHICSTIDGHDDLYKCHDSLLQIVQLK